MPDGMKVWSRVGGGAVRRGRRRVPKRGDVLQRRQGIHEVDQGESQVTDLVQVVNFVWSF